MKEQTYFLYAFERLINDHNKIHRELFHTKTISEIFYKFYDEDIIEQDTFIHWYENLPSKYLVDKSISKKIRQMAKEFIQWLNQSDDQESDNEK